ncbi:hypothetical protein CBM2589_B230041 [Cupriavidus taiwanensis]|uniref:Transposase n=1 Tax=Cupriavidus taiwanensis TaxID=164546 RepID=A0A375BQK3_9BURK|nr:hypothetical protein CBM2589_B230041 [Cupriavidus taiwanensis]
MVRKCTTGHQERTASLHTLYGLLDKSL